MYELADEQISVSARERRKKKQVASSLQAGSGHGSFAIVCFGID
jgi:hypothetical protein